MMKRKVSVFIEFKVLLMMSVHFIDVVDSSLRIEPGTVIRGKTFAMICETDTSLQNPFAYFFRSKVEGEHGDNVGEIQFNRQTNSCILQKNGSYLLSCNNDGKEMTLTVPANSVDMEHETYWKCQTSINSAGPDSNVINIYVNVPAELVRLQNSTRLNVTERESAVVVCKTHPCRPTAEIFWMKDGKNITDLPTTNDTTYVDNDLYITMGSLIYSGLKEDNGKILTCGAYNGFGSSHNSENFTLSIYYGPYYVHTYPSGVLTVDEGGHLNITCSGECNPLCDSYRWHNDTQHLVGSFRSYMVAGISRDKSGVYTCTVKNTVTSKTSTAQITITVNYPPTITLESRNGSYYETGLKINCTAQGMPENYTFRLTHNSLFSGIEIRQLNFESVSKGKIIHQFTNSSYMDSGMYTCTVTNGIADYRDGSLYQNVSNTVLIRGAPSITSSDTSFHAKKGQIGKLTVEFYNSLLNAGVTWYIINNGNRTQLQSSDKYNITVASATVSVSFYNLNIEQPGFMTTLEVINVTETDFSSYEVYIKNSVGESPSFTLDLRPSGGPDVPKNIEIVPSSITAISVDLKWMSGFHGGYNQSFVIEFQQQNDKSWTKYPEVVFGGMEQNKYFNISVRGLRPKSTYLFRLYATNEYNTSDFSTIINATTNAEGQGEEMNREGTDEAIIGGAVGAVALVLFIAVAGFCALLYKRRNLFKSHSNDTHQEEEESNRPDSVVCHNQAHVTVEDGESLAAVQSEESTKDPQDNIYAQVVKPKKRQISVEKQKHLSYKVNNLKKKGAVTRDRDEYENAPTYEKDISTTVGNKKASWSTGGLAYADVEIVTPNTRGGKPIVIGLENRTNYAAIAFGVRGEPLPEIDDETEDVASRGAYLDAD